MPQLQKNCLMKRRHYQRLWRAVKQDGRYCGVLMDIYSLLDKMAEYEASDLYLTVGLPPSWRGNNIVKDEGAKPLTNEEILGMLEQITTDSERDLNSSVLKR